MSFYRHLYSRPQTVQDETFPARFEVLLAKPISDKDREFVASLKQGYEKYGSLTVGQASYFGKVEERYSEANLKAQAEFVYDDEKKRIAKICAEYYSRLRYFGSVAENVLQDPAFVPTKKQYEAMCENKYAKRLIAAHDAELAFDAGNIVKVVMNKKWKRFVTGVVVNVEEKVEANKGGRHYRVYILSTDGSYEALVGTEYSFQERDMKLLDKVRKAKQ